MWDTGIADRLRAAGLNVVEIAGWQVRGSNLFDPRGSLDHHTAGSASGNAPSLAICIYGRADLPGPLCQVLIGRDNTCYVIAAGKANHAGTGAWQGLTGNKTVYGIERENVGTTAEPWRPDQTDVAARAHAALIRGRAGADMVCRHAEWTARKVDTHSVHGPTLRAMVANYLASTPAPTVQEDDVYYIAIGDDGSPAVYAVHGNTKMHFSDQVHVDRFVWAVEVNTYAAGVGKQVIHGGKNPDGITGVKPVLWPIESLNALTLVGHSGPPA